MTNGLMPSEMTPEQLRGYLAEERENGFLNLPQESRLFALEFISLGSIPLAADAAGVTREQGKRMMRDPLVRCFINYLNQQKERYSLIDASFIEVQYLNLLAKTLGEEAVPYIDKEGDQREGRIFEASVARATLQDLAKISGHYKDDPSVVINQNNLNLSDEQKANLDKLLDGQF